MVTTLPQPPTTNPPAIGDLVRIAEELVWLLPEGDAEAKAITLFQGLSAVADEREAAVTVDEDVAA